MRSLVNTPARRGSTTDGHSEESISAIFNKNYYVMNLRDEVWPWFMGKYSIKRHESKKKQIMNILLKV
jgi:hypothetical protein